MFISILVRYFAYIDTTKCLKTIIKSHNSGHSSNSNNPSYLSPYDIITSIFGFVRRRNYFRCYIENKWNETIYEIIQKEVVYPIEFMLYVNDVICHFKGNQFGIEPS